MIKNKVETKTKKLAKKKLAEKSTKKSVKKTTTKEKPAISPKGKQAGPRPPLTEPKAMSGKAPQSEGLGGKSKKRKYFETVGRRKTAVARVRLFTASPSQSVIEGNLIINGKPYKEFFPTLELQNTIEAPLRRLKSLNRFMVTVKVKGGGISGQAGAVKHGLARALILFDSNFRKKLKKTGYLTRDSRKKERKKYGLKKARRGPQWSKR